MNTWTTHPQYASPPPGLTWGDLVRMNPYRYGAYEFAVDSVRVDERRMRDAIRAACHERWTEAVARKWKFLPGSSFESTWFDYVLNDLECQYWRSLCSP